MKAAHVPVEPSHGKVSLREFRDFRKAVVDALHDHPEWKKTKARPHDLAENVVPDTPEARVYWRIRNGTQGIARKQANIDEEISVRLGDAYDPRGGGEWMLDDQDSVLVAKWRREFEEIIGERPPESPKRSVCPQCSKTVTRFANFCSNCGAWNVGFLPDDEVDVVYGEGEQAERETETGYAVHEAWVAEVVYGSADSVYDDAGRICGWEDRKNPESRCRFLAHEKANS